MSSPPRGYGGTRSSSQSGGGEPSMRRTYVTVLVVWVAVLMALFLFQEYFS